MSLEKDINNFGTPIVGRKHPRLGKKYQEARQEILEQAAREKRQNPVIEEAKIFLRDLQEHQLVLLRKLGFGKND